MKRAIFAAAGTLLLTAAPAFAHHPFSAEFDANAPVHINGKVSRIDWGNPHVMIQVVATNGNQNWTLEAASPTELAKKGWSRDTVKIGDQIAVDAYKAKSEPNTASARTIELPGGKKLSAADDEDGGPKASLSP
jgi:Family of unknown function (DUF6152)